MKNTISKNRIYKILSIVLVILWCATVFYLSSEVADDSSGTSGNTIRFVFRIISPNIDTLTLDTLVEMLQPLVRKMAHFTLYMIGGILIFNMLDLFIKDRKKVFCTSLTCGVFYAITDEFHQLFVLGRSCEIRDVIIDSLGILCGISVIMLITIMYEEYKK